MYLWQKLGYKYHHIEEQEDFDNVIDLLLKDKPTVTAFDTETTGLHIIKDYPFIIGFGYGNYLYSFDLPNEKWLKKLIYVFSETFVKYVFAHNVKFDYHMVRNSGVVIPETTNLADTMVLARLTEYADSLEGVGLSAVAKRLIDPNADLSEHIIKAHLKKLRREEAKRVRKTEEEPCEINYLSSYLDKPNLMRNYLADDVAMVLEIANRLMPVLTQVDDDLCTFKREQKVMFAVAEMERTGLLLDFDYMEKSRKRVESYKDYLYLKLHEITGIEFTSGQHKVIKRVFEKKYKIGMSSTDKKALSEVVQRYEDEPAEVANIILKLRSLDKWLSTYIDGMLERAYEGRVYTDINNVGTITGRVSSDLQQQPKKPLVDDDGNELFHPRKAFIADPGHHIVLIDYDSMEMRVQAEYTILLNDPDPHMCSGFVPYEHTSIFTGEPYNFEKDYENWNSGEWYKNDKPWKPTDLHALSATSIYPDLSEDDPNFYDIRQMGKTLNFLKNYGGGIHALMENLGFSEELALKTNSGYYEKYPKVLNYQKWVSDCIYQYGYAENLFGRRYYIQNNRFAYKVYNYLVQGACADLLKEKEVELHERLKKKDTNIKMMMVVHDEVLFLVPDEEMDMIWELRDIMQNTRDCVKNIPMLCKVEKTNTSWGEKKEVIECQT